MPLAALATWIVNDRVLKAAWPGFVTGKLSDIAGLIVVPLALQAVWELGLWAAARWRGPSMRVLGIAMLVTGAAFAASQVWPPAISAYAWGLGMMQWPLRVLAALLGGGSLPGIVPVVAVADVGDLLALPALGVTWWVGLRRVRAARPAR